MPSCFVNGFERMHSSSPSCLTKSKVVGGLPGAVQGVCAVAFAEGNAGDEGKPRCQNCVDRNFQCQYGPQLSFLTKNAQTVESSEVENKASQYEAIKFVNEDPQKQDSEGDSPDGNSFNLSHETAGKEQTLPESTEPSLSKRPHDSNAELSIWPFDGASQPSPQSNNNTRLFSDKDESAVAGLLALGTGTNEAIEPNLNLSDFAISSPTREHLPNHLMGPLKLPDIPEFLAPDQGLYVPHRERDLSSTETLELLRYYRYSVAPWLDICDQGQMFGIQGLQLAMISDVVYDAVLTLSEASMNLLQSPHREHRDRQIQDSQLEFTTTAFLRSLEAAKECFLDVPSAWSTKRPIGGEYLDTICSHTRGRDFNSAVYWLFVRLDLAAALATDTDLQISLPPSPPYMADMESGDDPFSSVFCYAHRPLWLCGRAIQFTHDENPSPQCPPLHTWMHLVEELENWYQERPQGFQPMLELGLDDRDGLEPSFPVVLFANGAGAFGNQLYHTAMLLLLHNRPRTARTNDFHSARMSPLWHAQRICSIALNNDRRECWDPCLLASFLLAARRMTHETQQQEILFGLNHIRSVTGWDVGSMLNELQEEWGILET